MLNYTYASTSLAKVFWNDMIKSTQVGSCRQEWCGLGISLPVPRVGDWVVTSDTRDQVPKAWSGLSARHAIDD